MSDFATPTESGPAYVPPDGWKPRADGWADAAVPMPKWARDFARTGTLPPAAERVSGVAALSMDEVDEARAMSSYSKAWRGMYREMTRLKSEAAQVLLRLRATPDDRLYRAAAQRCYDVDLEHERLRIDRDKGAPLVMRRFPPLDEAAAGQSIAAAERAASRNPLFDHAAAAAHDVGELEREFLPGGL